MCKDKVKVFNNNDVTNDSLRYSCNYCNKIFKSRQYKWEHQNKFCKIKKTDELKEENTTIIELKRENLEIKNTLSELLKLCKIHPKTLQKINKKQTAYSTKKPNSLFKNSIKDINLWQQLIPTNPITSKFYLYKKWKCLT